MQRDEASMQRMPVERAESREQREDERVERRVERGVGDEKRGEKSRSLELAAIG